MQRDARGPVERGLLGEPERSGGEASNPRSETASTSEVLSKATRRRFKAHKRTTVWATDETVSRLRATANVA